MLCAGRCHDSVNVSRETLARDVSGGRRSGGDWKRWPAGVELRGRAVWGEWLEECFT